MPPGTRTSRQEWPNGIYSDTTFKFTGEPFSSYRSENGKTYIDLTTASNSGNSRVGRTLKLDDLKNYVNQDTVSIARLWSTGLWGLIQHPQSEVYSAVKLFRVDLVTSQDSLEPRMPYMFWNGFTPKPYTQVGNDPWHFLITRRSPYSYKTATQLREWIDFQKSLETGRAPVNLGVDTSTGPSIADRYGNPAPASTSLGAQYFDLRVNDYLTLQLPLSSHPWANNNWYRNFGEIVIANLVDKGFSTATIANNGYKIIDYAIKKLEALSLPGSNTTNIGGGTTGSSGGAVPPSNSTVTPSDPINIFNVQVRLPSGAQIVDTDAMSKIDQSTIKPHLRQAFTNSSGDRVEEAFYFNYVPSTISYTLGGSVWNEIPRTFDAPITEWSSYGLTRVQMTFLIAGARLIDGDGGKISLPDGLNVHIDDRIQLLRRMASRTAPVVVYGLDDIFNIQLERSQTTGAPCAWAISDLSITAKRRTDGTPSRISVAQVNMSLIEFPLEITAALRLPTLQLQTPTPAPGNTRGSTAIRPDLWTEFLMKPIQNSLLVEG